MEMAWACTMVGRAHTSFLPQLQGDVFLSRFGTWIPRLIVYEPWTPSPGSGVTAS